MSPSLPEERGLMYERNGGVNNIAVFASGRGSNFEAIAKQVKAGRVKACLKILVCDQPLAGVLKKAKKFKINTVLLRREDFSDRDSFEDAIIACLKANKIDLIVMAGFMRMLGHKLINAYKDKIINIHPALLPSFKGAHAIKDAFDYGAKVTGVTVHFVDEKMDHGPIILQESLPIRKNDTLASLERRIHQVEHRLYPQAINLFINGRIKIKGRKVKIN